MPPLTPTNIAPEETLAPALSRAEVVVGVLFLVALSGAMAGLYLIAPNAQPVDPLLVLLSVVLITLAHGARFDLPLAWTSPVQLSLVPVLFLLPPWLVPATMGVSIVIARTPDGLLLLIAMLTAQIGADFAVSVIWQQLTAPAQLIVQVKEAFPVYLLDVMLFPVGLLAALSIDDSPYYLALMIPLFGVLAVFASERRARLEQLTELNGTYRGTAMVLADVVDADDAYTGMHTRDVVDLSLVVADQLGLGAERRRNVEFGALLRDVGKVAIPNEIINKPAPLDGEEWAVMRTHTIEGQRMLDRVGGAMSEVGAIVRGSHERWDGGGYPDGLASEAIPLESRSSALATPTTR